MRPESLRQLLRSLFVVRVDLRLEEFHAARRTGDLIELVLRTAFILDLFYLDLDLHENADGYVAPPSVVWNT